MTKERVQSANREGGWVRPLSVRGLSEALVEGGQCESEVVEKEG